jgi:hypothetical protein
MRRLLIALPVASLAAAAASVLPPAATPARVSAASCRTAEVQVHDEAVFGHFASPGPANALKKRAAALGFQGIKIESDGCADYEVEIDGADRSADRVSFAAEAQRAGFPVTFEQIGPPLDRKPGSTYGVFGTFGTITAADHLVLRLAAVNFRYIDIAYQDGKRIVVMPAVPLKATLSIANEVHKAGFHIAFHS